MKNQKGVTMTKFSTIEELLSYIEKLGLSSKLTKCGDDNYYLDCDEDNSIRLHYDIDTRVVYPLMDSGENGYLPISDDDLVQILKGVSK